LNKVLSEMLHVSVETTGCGRTDTGVHADDFYLHFDWNQGNLNVEELFFRLKVRKIEGIQFKELFPVREDAHARFSAWQRSYEYRISDENNPFQQGLVHIMRKFPDVELMNRAAQLLLGKQDFECFSRTHTQVNSFICDVREAEWMFRGDLLVFKISADRFLRNMVRAIVGSMLEIGEGKKNVSWMAEVLNSKDRKLAGSSAAAQGLFLTDIKYPEDIRI